MRRGLIAGAAALAGLACVAPYTHTVLPIVRLAEVERPASAREQWGDFTLSTLNDTGVTRYSFEDNLISASFVVRHGDILMSLQNRSNHSVRLLWNEATMVLPDGEVSPVMTDGWRYSECRSEKPPAVVPRSASVSSMVVPCSRLSTISYEWIKGALYPVSVPTAAYDSTVDAVVGLVKADTYDRPLRFLLPIQIEGVTNEYTFGFIVDSVHVHRRFQ